MNAFDILEALPPRVYLRRGELFIHFSTADDLMARLGETLSALTRLSQQDDNPRPIGRKPREPRVEPAVVVNGEPRSPEGRRTRANSRSQSTTIAETHSHGAAINTSETWAESNGRSSTGKEA